MTTVLCPFDYWFLISPFVAEGLQLIATSASLFWVNFYFFPCLITHISQYTSWTLLTLSDITFRKSSHLDFVICSTVVKNLVRQISKIFQRKWSKTWMCYTKKVKYLLCNLHLFQNQWKRHLWCIAYIYNTCKCKPTFLSGDLFLFISLPIYLLWIHASRFRPVAVLSSSYVVSYKLEWKR